MALMIDDEEAKTFEPVQEGKKEVKVKTEIKEEMSEVKETTEKKGCDIVTEVNRGFTTK